jgi:spore maturation protein CgeB
LRAQHIIDGVPDGLIMRHFEVPGAGGFLMSTRGGGATSLFPQGETGEYFSDLAECVEKAKYYIANESERRRLVERAHSKVASEHQYTDRARQIIRLLEECR